MEKYVFFFQIFLRSSISVRIRVAAFIYTINIGYRVHIVGHHIAGEIHSGQGSIFASVAG